MELKKSSRRSNNNNMKLVYIGFTIKQKKKKAFKYFYIFGSWLFGNNTKNIHIFTYLLFFFCQDVFMLLRIHHIVCGAFVHVTIYVMFKHELKFLHIKLQLNYLNVWQFDRFWEIFKMNSLILVLCIFRNFARFNRLHFCGKDQNVSCSKC